MHWHNNGGVISGANQEKMEQPTLFYSYLSFAVQRLLVLAAKQLHCEEIKFEIPYSTFFFFFFKYDKSYSLPHILLCESPTCSFGN